jgi:hypothetical protein
VEIRAFRRVPLAMPTPGMKDYQEVNYLPARYNDETTLKAQVASGPNIFSFEVVSE